MDVSPDQSTLSTDRLAFSTLGCPGQPVADTVALAQRTGWLGLELRSAPDEPINTALTSAQRAAVRGELTGVTPLCVASYVRVADRSVDDAACVTDLLAEATLAADLGAIAVRVFPGGAGDGEGDAPAVRRLRSAVAELPDGIEVWLETHDSHRRGADVARILDAVGGKRARAIWDVMHPWAAGEPVDETARALEPWLAHVQIKDRPAGGQEEPAFLGTGAVPLTEVFDQLRALEYPGWLSLEWERKWYPTAAPLEEALTAGRTWLESVLN